jgi:hypothetical protein
MGFFKVAVIFVILLMVGIYSFVFINIDKNPEPVSTIQYSSPIGPTQTPPYQLESKSLLDAKE